MNKGIKVAVTTVSAVAIMATMGSGLTLSSNSTIGSYSPFSIVASAADNIPNGNDGGGGTTSTGTSAAQQKLQSCLTTGKYTGSDNTATVDVSTNKYKLEGGGQTEYTALVDESAISTGYIKSDEFQKLKSAEKGKFLADMNSVATETVNESDIVSEDTRQDWLSNVQRCPGVGTQLIAALLENTKPDYAKANQIYKPFSGIVGTTLGLLAILLVALLGIVMALDLSYISLPLFRTFVSGPDDGGSSGSGESKPKLISWEAVNAVRTAESSGGSSGQSSGGSKNAVALYFKHRVFMLAALGVCLLYLVSGRIWSLVAWLVDLFSGLF